MKMIWRNNRTWMLRIQKSRTGNKTSGGEIQRIGGRDTRLGTRGTPVLEPEEEGRGELQGDLGGSFLDGVLELQTVGDLRGPPSFCSLLLTLETGF